MLKFKALAVLVGLVVVLLMYSEAAGWWESSQTQPEYKVGDVVWYQDVEWVVTWSDGQDYEIERTDGSRLIVVDGHELSQKGKS